MRQPGCVFWGPDLLCVPNEAFLDGHGTGAAMPGRPARLLWPALLPDLAGVLAGGPAVADRPMRLRDGGGPGWTVCLSPVPEAGAPGGIGGVLLLATEVSHGVSSRLRALFDAMDEGFVLGDVLLDDAGRAVDLRYAEANAAAIALIGADPRGRTLREVIPTTEPHWVETFGRVALTGRAERLERFAPRHGRWFDVHVFKAEAADPASRRIAVLFHDITARRTAEERQALLAREVDHRAKNALAIVQTMLRLTRAEDVPAFARAVEARVAALARAQTLLAERAWDGAGLRALMEGELAPFLGASRARLDGPEVTLPPGVAQPLAMALHELATNAAKHGALSVPDGRVALTWHVGLDRALRLRWSELGGPPVAGPPTRSGFGARVLEGTLRRQLGGLVELYWQERGLVAEIALPLDGRTARRPA